MGALTLTPNIATWTIAALATLGTAQWEAIEEIRDRASSALRGRPGAA